MPEQPEALRLADLLSTHRREDLLCMKAATELWRLYEERKRLLEVLKMVEITVHEALTGVTGNGFTYPFDVWANAVGAAIDAAMKEEA